MVRPVRGEATTVVRSVRGEATAMVRPVRGVAATVVKWSPEMRMVVPHIG